LDFDTKDELDMEFLTAAANLRAFNFGIKPETDRNYYIEALKKVAIPKLVIDKSKKIAANDAELKEQAQQGVGMEDLEAKAKALIEALPSPSSFGSFRTKPCEFEKDDDTNYHIAFITACSNLRARNYKIKEESKHQTKFIAGKIIPAIATTTALVTGLVCLELYKIIQKKPLEAYRNTYANLALPLFSMSEPFPPQYKKLALKAGDQKEWKWSLWDKIDCPLVDPPLQDFLDWFTDKYGLEVDSVLYKVTPLYSALRKKANRMKWTFSKMLKEIGNVELGAKERYITVEVTSVDEEDKQIDIPTVRLRMKE
jgi:ubiquitin-activating enzyme E1